MEFAIKGKRISGAKALDALKDYSGKLGLGLNAFSALSNVTIGKTQMFIEGIGGEYFGYKDMLWAKKEYYYLLGGYIAEINAVNPTNKLKLLMDRFDV
jgi:hypothetical protein